MLKLFHEVKGTEQVLFKGDGHNKVKGTPLTETPPWNRPTHHRDKRDFKICDCDVNKKVTSKHYFALPQVNERKHNEMNHSIELWI